MIAEKVRAAFQRAKVRDLYDLHRFASTPLPGDLLRHLVVLKLWQTQDPFDPEVLIVKIHGETYDWDDLRRLLRAGDEIRPGEMIDGVDRRFGFLRELSDLDRQLIADARSGWTERLAERVRGVIRGLSSGSI